LQRSDFALDLILPRGLQILLLLPGGKQQARITAQLSLQAGVNLFEEDLRLRAELRKIRPDRSANLGTMNVAALHLRRKIPQHLIELLLMLQLLVGKLPGTDQPAKSRTLGNNGQIHQFEARSHQYRQRRTGYQREQTSTYQGNPVVLPVKCSSYVVGVVFRRRRDRPLLEIARSHLDTHPHLTVARSLAQAAEHVVL